MLLKNGKYGSFGGRIEYPTGAVLNFTFDGEPKYDGIDYDKLGNQLENALKGIVSGNMVHYVTCIRTILKDYEEEDLIIEYFVSEDNFEQVHYGFGEIWGYRRTFERNNYEVIDESNLVSISYTKYEGLSFKCDGDVEGSIIDSQYSDDEGPKLFNEMINRIYCLKDACALGLDKNSKKLIEAYRLFYKEDPDFTDFNIANFRFQNMVFILLGFGVSFDIDYYFSRALNKPVSMNLSKRVSDLSQVVGKVDENIYSDRVFLEDVRKIIEFIGESIRKEIGDDCCQEQALIEIARVIYVEKYSKGSYLCELDECSPEFIDTNVKKLVKSISNNDK